MYIRNKSINYLQSALVQNKRDLNNRNNNQVTFTGSTKFRQTKAAAAAALITAVINMFSGTVKKIDAANEIRKVQSYISTQINVNDLRMRRRPKAIVIDDFNRFLDLNKDKKADISHGRLCSIQIKNYCPSAKIEAYHCRGGNIIQINKAVHDVFNRIQSGEKIDAVNISLNVHISIKDLSKITGLNLTRDNIASYKQEIIKRLKQPHLKGTVQALTSNVTGFYMKTVDAIETINKIVKSGTAVDIAAGNDKYSVNLLNLADSINVGATKYYIPTEYSGNNSLVNRWEEDLLEFIPLENNGKIIGLDSNKDGIPEILIKELSGNNPPVKTSNRGTSFAAPRSVGMDLQDKLN